MNYYNYIKYTLDHIIFNSFNIYYLQIFNSHTNNIHIIIHNIIILFININIIIACFIINYKYIHNDYDLT